jgi:hypothetical protein
MIRQRPMGGEGASTPWTRPEPGMAVGLVVCPVAASGVGLDIATIQEIYHMAYERARAALRPSLYERALLVCGN